MTRYPLTGIRAATTEPQLALVRCATDVLQDDDRVVAAWLAGSFATGEAHPWSDVDIHCCVQDDVPGETWRDLLAKITPTVLATALPPPTAGGYALTPEWVHVDMLGNIVTVVGPDDAALAMLGVLTVRDTCLVPLFLAERGVRRRGGVKRLNRWLSKEQAGPAGVAAAARRDGRLGGGRAALPGTHLHRPRPGARRGLDEPWPEELEAATLRHVERGLGISAITA